MYRFFPAFICKAQIDFCFSNSNHNFFVKTKTSMKFAIGNEVGSVFCQFIFRLESEDEAADDGPYLTLLINFYLIVI